MWRVFTCLFWLRVVRLRLWWQLRHNPERKRILRIIDDELSH